jgi:hypothetical protein
MKTFMAELDRNERLRVLRDNCDSQEETTYMRDLSDDEMDAKRELHTENCIKIEDAETILEEAKERCKAVTKPLNKVNSVLIGELKHRKTQVKGTLFNIADPDSGMMETYDEEGYLIKSRRLSLEEKSKLPFPLAKASNQ